MKNIFITVLIVVASISSFAQQDAMFTHYMFNTLSVNPAYAGTREALTITGLHRSQWVGFDGAPQTQTLTLHTPIFNENLGVGLSVVNDRIGPTNMTSVYGDFAYKIKINEKAKLSLGLSGGLNIRRNALMDIPLDDDSDVSFAKNEESELLPNFGFGAYYYTDKFYVGLSAPKLLENNFKTNEIAGGTSLASEARHYFFIAGMIFNINKEFKLKPTVLVKYTNAAPIEADITATLLYKDKIWGGLMYRTGDAAGVLIGMYVTPQLAVGYSFDWSFGNKTVKYNAGSHEIMLMYDLVFNNKEKIRSPRYF